MLCFGFGNPERRQWTLEMPLALKPLSRMLTSTGLRGTSLEQRDIRQILRLSLIDLSAGLPTVTTSQAHFQRNQEVVQVVRVVGLLFEVTSLRATPKRSDDD